MKLRILGSRKGVEQVMVIIIAALVLLVVAAILIYIFKEKTSDATEAMGCPADQCDADAPCPSGYRASFQPCREQVGEERKMGRCCVKEDI